MFFVFLCLRQEGFRMFVLGTNISLLNDIWRSDNLFMDAFSQHTVRWVNAINLFYSRELEQIETKAQVCGGAKMPTGTARELSCGFSFFCLLKQINRWKQKPTNSISSWNQAAFPLVAPSADCLSGEGKRRISPKGQTSHICWQIWSDNPKPAPRKADQKQRTNSSNPCKLSSPVPPQL